MIQDALAAARAPSPSDGLDAIAHPHQDYEVAAHPPGYGPQGRLPETVADPSMVLRRDYDEDAKDDDDERWRAAIMTAAAPLPAYEDDQAYESEAYYGNSHSDDERRALAAEHAAEHAADEEEAAPIEAYWDQIVPDVDPNDPSTYTPDMLESVTRRALRPLDVDPQHQAMQQAVAFHNERVRDGFMTGQELAEEFVRDLRELHAYNERLEEAGMRPHEHTHMPWQPDPYQTEDESAPPRMAPAPPPGPQEDALGREAAALARDDAAWVAGHPERLQRQEGFRVAREALQNREWERAYNDYRRRMLRHYEAAHIPSIEEYRQDEESLLRDIDRDDDRFHREFADDMNQLNMPGLQIPPREEFLQDPNVHIQRYLDLQEQQAAAAEQARLEAQRRADEQAAEAAFANLHMVDKFSRIHGGDLQGGRSWGEFAQQHWKTGAKVAAGVAATAALGALAYGAHKTHQNYSKPAALPAAPAVRVAASAPRALQETPRSVDEYIAKRRTQVPRYTPVYRPPESSGPIDYDADMGALRRSMGLGRGLSGGDLKELMTQHWRTGHSIFKGVADSARNLGNPNVGRGGLCGGDFNEFAKKHWKTGAKIAAGVAGAAALGALSYGAHRLRGTSSVEDMVQRGNDRMAEHRARLRPNPLLDRYMAGDLSGGRTWGEFAKQHWKTGAKVAAGVAATAALGALAYGAHKAHTGRSASAGPVASSTLVETPLRYVPHPANADRSALGLKTFKPVPEPFVDEFRAQHTGIGSAEKHWATNRQLQAIPESVYQRYGQQKPPPMDSTRFGSALHGGRTWGEFAKQNWKVAAGVAGTAALGALAYGAHRATNGSASSAPPAFDRPMVGQAPTSVSVPSRAPVYAPGIGEPAVHLTHNPYKHDAVRRAPRKKVTWADGGSLHHLHGGRTWKDWAKSQLTLKNAAKAAALGLGAYATYKVKRGIDHTADAFGNGQVAGIAGRAAVNAAGYVGRQALNAGMSAITGPSTAAAAAAPAAMVPVPVSNPFVPSASNPFVSMSESRPRASSVSAAPAPAWLGSTGDSFGAWTGPLPTPKPAAPAAKGWTGWLGEAVNNFGGSDDDWRDMGVGWGLQPHRIRGAGFLSHMKQLGGALGPGGLKKATMDRIRALQLQRRSEMSPSCEHGAAVARG